MTCNKPMCRFSPGKFAAFVVILAVSSSFIGSAGAVFFLNREKPAPVRKPRQVPETSFQIEPGVKDHFQIICPYCRARPTVYYHVPDGVIRGHVSGDDPFRNGFQMEVK